MTDYAELIAKLAELTGPDRDIDADLWWMLRHADALRCFNNGALGMPRQLPATLPIPAGLGRAGVQAMAPRYTDSVDAALSLIESHRGWRLYTVDASIPDRFSVFLKGPDRLWPATEDSAEIVAPGWESSTAKTLPAALCSAMLTALQAQEATTPLAPTLASQVRCSLRNAGSGVFAVGVVAKRKAAPIC